jgi:hypothetical protein
MFTLLSVQCFWWLSRLLESAFALPVLCAASAGVPGVHWNSKPLFGAADFADLLNDGQFIFRYQGTVCFAEPEH